MKLPHTEVKFYTEVKSQTGLSSLGVSCKRARSEISNRSEFSMQTVNARSEIKLRRIIKVNN